MFELNLTYFIFIGMFLLFMQALNKVFLEPIGQVIEKRKALIKNAVDDGASARAQANGLVEEYERDMKAARSAAQTVITEATAGAQQERNLALKKLHDEGQAKLTANKTAVTAEKNKLVADLVEEEKTIVTTIIQKLLGSNVAVSLDNGAIQHALVAEESR